jgi:basic membrane protein A
MYEQGADVVYHAAGGSGGGLFEAAKEFSTAEGAKVWAIGVDSDQYNTASEDVREYILTSMLKRVDVAVYLTITEFLNTGSVGGVSSFDLGSDGVGYSTSGGFVDDISNQLEDLRALIVTGQLTVPQVIGGDV